MVTARQELGTLAAAIACDSRVSAQVSSMGVALRCWKAGKLTM